MVRLLRQLCRHLHRFILGLANVFALGFLLRALGRMLGSLTMNLLALHRYALPQLYFPSGTYSRYLSLAFFAIFHGTLYVAAHVFIGWALALFLVFWFQWRVSLRVLLAYYNEQVRLMMRETVHSLAVGSVQRLQDLTL